MIWRQIPEWPDYEISVRGDIRRPTRTRAGFSGLRKPYKKAAPRVTPYLYIVLRRPGYKRAIAIHRLVALTYIGPPPFVGAQAAHKDGDSMNNYYRNLIWVTRSENERQKVAHGKSNRGERNRAARLSAGQVSAIRARIRAGDLLKDIAARYGVSWQAISSIKVGKSWAWL